MREEEKERGRKGEREAKREREEREHVFLLRTQQPRLFRTRAVTEHDLRVENRAASEKLLVVRTSANM